VEDHVFDLLDKKMANAEQERDRIAQRMLRLDNEKILFERLRQDDITRTRHAFHKEMEKIRRAEQDFMKECSAQNSAHLNTYKEKRGREEENRVRVEQDIDRLKKQAEEIRQNEERADKEEEEKLRKRKEEEIARHKDMLAFLAREENRMRQRQNKRKRSLSLG